MHPELPVPANESVRPYAGPLAALQSSQRKSFHFRLWMLTGIFFMVLPGTLLGFTNLLQISASHGLSGLAAAWIQAHGHAQVFGWIGSFVLGIGFYSQPETPANRGRLPLLCWGLWTAGLGFHWLSRAFQWHWRILLPLSGLLELLAILLFLRAARQHKLPSSSTASRRIPLWMQSVLLSNLALLLAILLNFVEACHLAWRGLSPAIPHALDQSYLVLLAWGFLVPLIWGFSARWLPAFLGLAALRTSAFRLALVLNTLGVLLGMVGFVRLATVLLAAAALLAVWALQLFSSPVHPAKTAGIHASFPLFVRIAYLWSILAPMLGVWAAWADHHGGIWGGSRHGLTVGFAAMMVMTIGPRILPHFAGIRQLWSPRLMLATLVFLLLGCTLRVSMEVVAYEGIASFAWHLLPLSGVLELTAVLCFALQILLTLLRGQAILPAES